MITALEAWLGTVKLSDIGRRTRLADELQASAIRMDPDLGKAARSYIEKGIAVFPCWPKAKEPLTKDGFYSATTDPALVSLWFRESCNIGAPTGRTFDVVDIDTLEGVRNFMLHDEINWRDGLLGVALTGRPGVGLHLFYPVTGAPSSKPFGKAGGVDIKGKGGYVLLPPSIHPSGTPYRWLQRPAL